MRKPLSLFVVVVLLVAGPAWAQPNPRTSESRPGAGEKYWIEFSATWWRPALDGSISSDRLGLIGSTIDFISDLGFENSRHSDVRVVLRPAKKHKLRFQYSPIEFTGDSVLARDVTFAGRVYPIALPVQSMLTWKVMRLGYEWDFFYRRRGFVGVLLEVRRTELTAGIDSIIGSGEVFGSAPLPALGFVGRFYPIRELAIHIEGAGLKLTDLTPEHAFKMLDVEASATYNLTRNLGVSAGWRRMNTNLRFDADRGELNFKGMWFGGVVRY